MNRTILATALLLVALPCAPRADAAPEPGKGVGKLDCVSPITEAGHGIAVGRAKCVTHWEHCQDGWFGRVTSKWAGDWPWLGPFADQQDAAWNAWHAAYGHGC